MPIVTYHSNNPMVDGRQSDKALMVQRGVMRYFQKNGITMLPELTLANNRRADLIGINRKGKIILIEVKSSIEDFKVDQKWHEYLDFCDYFYFASHEAVPSGTFPEQQGLIIADGYGAEITREACEEKVNAATRKALTLRIARAATQRLERILQFAQSTGFETPEDINQLHGE